MQNSMHALLVTGALFLVGADAQEKKVQPPDEAVAAALKSLGAQVELDDHGDVIGVTFGEHQKLGNDALSPLTRLAHLKNLNFCKTSITDAGLASLENLTSLEFLGLAHTKVSDEGLVHLKRLTELRILNIAGTPITGSGLVHLADAKKLEYLIASNSRFSDAGMVHLKTHRNLRRLFLSGSQVSAAGLASLTGFFQIGCLLLEDTKVSDAGLVHLKDLKSLGYLWLEKTQVTDAGLESLRGLNRLHSLHLTGTKVTSAGIKRLQAALPKCRIEYAAVQEEERKQKASGNAKDDLVPLDVRPPKDVFDGSSIRPDDEPYLEKPRPRRPLLVPRGVVNIALHRPVSSSDPDPIIGELALVTDGETENADGNWVELARGPQWLQIDLEQSAPIYAIGIWRQWTRSCRQVVCHGVVVQVADAPQFKRNVRTLFNNDRENVHRLGEGADRRYVETREGKLIDAKGVRARYVRVYSNGSNDTDLNDCVEIAVWGLGREGQARPQPAPMPAKPTPQGSPPPVTEPTTGPVDAEDDRHRTALYHAAEAGGLDVVKSLLDKGADVNHIDFLGNSPLHVAIKEGHTAVAKLLLERGATAEQADNFGTRPIHVAAHSGCAEVLAMLIERQAQLDPQTSLGYTPLAWAVVMEHVEAARTLLTKGAGPNIADRRGYTPLHHAAQRGSREIVDLLLAGHAGVNAQTKNGRTPLDLAEDELRSVEEGRQAAGLGLPDAACLRRVIDGLRKAGGRNDRQLPPRTLHDAIRNANLAAAATLLRQGADPNACDGQGMAPLHRAVVNDDKAMVELLLAHGADPNRQGPYGELPLQLAAGQLLRLISPNPPHRGTGPFAPNRLSIAAMLLAKGARPNAGNRNALNAAAYANDLPMVNLLLAKGADPSQGDGGETALHIAARSGCVDMAQAILAAGAVVDARSCSGQTPLHEAAEGGHTEIVRMLLARRAAVNVTGLRNRTPLHLAAYEGSLAIVQMLLDAGAALNPLDANGETPLDLAENAEEQPVARLLMSRGGKTLRALNEAVRTGK